jgi:hypothetical protein
MSAEINPAYMIRICKNVPRCWVHFYGFIVLQHIPRFGVLQSGDQAHSLLPGCV